MLNSSNKKRQHQQISATTNNNNKPLYSFYVEQIFVPQLSSTFIRCQPMCQSGCHTSNAVRYENLSSACLTCFFVGHFNLFFGPRFLLSTAFLCLKLCQMCCAGLRYESKVYIAFKHPMFVQPYQDCQDVVKEVPYLAPEERCEKVSLARCFQS